MIEPVHAVRSLVCAALVAGCGRVGFDAPDAGANADAFAARICDRYPQAIYCNDFEDGVADLDFSDGTITQTGGYGGSVGMSFVASTGAMPRASYTLPMPIESDPLYVAGRLFLDAGAFIDDYLVLVQTTSNVNSKISFDIVDLDTPQVVNNVNNGGGRHAPTGAFPRGRWICYELMIDVSAASAGGVTLTIDGEQLLSDWQGFSTLPQGGWVRMEIGAFASPANTASATVTYDNWVIQAAPIGCP